MKSRFFMAAIAAIVFFVSCSNTPDIEQDTLTVKLSGVIGSRAIEAPGSTVVGTIQLNNGHIFVVNGVGAVTHSEALDVVEARNAGQVLTTKVAQTSRVYIVGNIPTGVNVANLTSFSAIQQYGTDIITQTNYAHAALANNTSQPSAITSTGDGTAAVTVSLNPLISRLELTQVKGSGQITSFDVTGVFVDDYHPQFTWDGSYTGTPYSHLQSTDFTGYSVHHSNTGAWSSDASLVVIPDAGKVWAYNVASGALPRLIIRLENVVAAPGYVGIDPGKVYYLTVTGYTGMPTATFERGKIYRVGGSNGITFDESNLEEIPNPVGVDLKVNVVIKEWELEDLGFLL